MTQSDESLENSDLINDMNANERCVAASKAWKPVEWDGYTPNTRYCNCDPLALVVAVDDAGEQWARLSFEDTADDSKLYCVAVGEDDFWHTNDLLSACVRVASNPEDAFFFNTVLASRGWTLSRDAAHQLALSRAAAWDDEEFQTLMPEEWDV
jgi:hypothetical protein